MRESVYNKNKTFSAFHNQLAISRISTSIFAIERKLREENSILGSDDGHATCHGWIGNYLPTAKGGHVPNIMLDDYPAFTSSRI